MPLCELTATAWSDTQALEALKEYLEKRLYRTVVQVKDSPAFLANRIGFQFINEALQYAERYRDHGGIDYLDAILGSFTGRAMAPLVTSDFVGLDVHSAIVHNLYENTHDYAQESFVLPSFVEKLIAEKKLGRKTGGGLYQRVTYENGLKRQLVYDINGGIYRDVIPYAFPFAEKMRRSIQEGNYRQAFACLVTNHSQEANICRRFLLNYIVYSLHAAGEVGYSLQAADDVMAAGFNWCPPLAMLQALRAVTDVPTLMRESLPEVCAQIDVDALLAEAEPSRYDYRPYFRSGRHA
ncbi:MAG: hypothetical protein IJ153_04820 [Clostridia bacterium]|nr:hypothetical protein [Clostridia bacterium]